MTIEELAEELAIRALNSKMDPNQFIDLFVDVVRQVVAIKQGVVVQ